MINSTDGVGRWARRLVSAAVSGAARAATGSTVAVTPDPVAGPAGVRSTQAAKSPVTKRPVSKRPAVKKSAATTTSSSQTTGAAKTAAAGLQKSAATPKRAAAKRAASAVKATRVTRASSAAKASVAAKVTSPARPSRAKPAGAKAAMPVAVKTVAVKATAAKPVEVKPVEVKAAAVKATAAKATAAKPAAAKTAVTRGSVAKAAPTKAAPTKAVSAKAAPRSLQVREDETPWTAAELREVRTELEHDVARLTSEIEMAETGLHELLRDSGEGTGDDQADAGAKTFEREQEIALANNSREMLVQSNRALTAIDDGTYGVCESCALPVGKMRLQAFPRATLCVSCKQRQERR